MSLRVMILSQNLCIENVESTEISSIVKSSETKTKRPRIAISNLYSGWKKSIITPHIPIFDLVTGNENETQAFDIFMYTSSSRFPWRKTFFTSNCYKGQSKFVTNEI